MLAEAALACFFAGNPAEMLSVAGQAQAGLPADPSLRARFLAAMAAGMARILGGTQPPAQKQCTKRSRSRRARPSCATISS